MLDAALLALGWLGSGLAALFAAALALRRGEAERWLAAGLGIAALASGLISASHAGLRSPALESAEVAATLAAGPLVASWCAFVVDLRVARGFRVLGFLPAATWAAAGLAGTAFAADRRAIRWAVAFQIGWTLAAAAVAARRWSGLGAARRRLLGGVLAGLAALHLAQLARLVAPGSTPANLVPATVGLLLGGLGFAVLRRARLPFALDALDGPAAAEANRLLAELDRWLVEQRIAFTEKRLSVAAAAGHLGVAKIQLSRTLNGHFGLTFSEHLAALRVAEAERLLADPALEHLAVEAIGGRAGFGSRSVFFAEFRRRAGCTPAEYRSRVTTGSA